MSTLGPLDAITIDAIRIIKLFKEKYPEDTIESIMALGSQEENTLTAKDRQKMEEFAQDFHEYFRAVRAAKLPQSKNVPDNRTIEERFPEFTAALTYRAPKPHYHVENSSGDNGDSNSDENDVAKKTSLSRGSLK